MLLASRIVCRAARSGRTPTLIADASQTRSYRHLLSSSARVRSSFSTTCAATEADAVVSEDQAEAAAEEEPLPTGNLDLRVGKIISCELHPDADSLYVEKIEVGEEEPRTIISGLVQFVPQDEMLDRNVVVICNLKARNMRGIKSHGMVLCASNEAHDAVEPLTPPAAAEVGERIFFEEEQPEAAKENRVQKKKLWEAVQPDLKTGDDLVAAFKGIPMMTSAGAVTAASLKGCSIS